MKIYLYKSLMTWLPRFLNNLFQPLTSCQRPFFLWHECWVIQVIKEFWNLCSSKQDCQHCLSGSFGRSIGFLQWRARNWLNLIFIAISLRCLFWSFEDTWVLLFDWNIFFLEVFLYYIPRFYKQTSRILEPSPHGLIFGILNVC